MLKIAPDEFKSAYGNSSIPIAAGPAVAERDLFVFKRIDTKIGYGDLEHLMRQIPNLFPATACGLDVHIPTGFPGQGVDLICKAGRQHGMAKPGAINFGKPLYWLIKIRPGAMPSAVLGVKSAAWCKIMNIRMILHLPSPGVQHPEKTRQITADVLFIRG